MFKDGIVSKTLTEIETYVTPDVYEFLEQIGVKTISMPYNKDEQIKYTYTFHCKDFDNKIYVYVSELSAIPLGGVCQFAAVKLMKEMNWTNGNESLRWYDR